MNDSDGHVQIQKRKRNGSMTETDGNYAAVETFTEKVLQDVEYKKNLRVAQPERATPVRIIKTLIWDVLSNKSFFLIIQI